MLGFLIGWELFGNMRPRYPFFFLNLFIHERHRERERGRDTGRGRSRLDAGSLT